MSRQESMRVRGVDYRTDLEQRLGDPEFAAEFEAAQERASLGFKIAKLRNQQGLSQAQLADRLNTSQSVISRYESADYSNYRLNTLRRLADALGSELRVEISPRMAGRRQVRTER